MKTITSIFLFVFLVWAGLFAEERPEFNPDLNFAQVVFVKAVETGSGSWVFYVTVRHNDEGWDHYADSWEIINPDTKEIYSKRILAHPHELEQPFTRSLSGIVFPQEQQFLLVRARCNLHGFGGEAVLVDLETEESDNFRVISK